MALSDKELGERFMDAYLSDASKHEVRRLKKEYREASKAGREELRLVYPERKNIYDYIENGG